MPGADSKSAKAPSFYSAAADMAMTGGKPGAGGGSPAGAGASGGDTAAEETKIITTLLEVYDKWEKLTKDPKRKQQIQQLATITKEIQSGQSGTGTPASADAGGGPTPEAGAGGGAGGAGGASTGSTTGGGSSMGQAVPA